MRNFLKLILAVVIAVIAQSQTRAQIVMDGTVDTAYGAALSIQNTDTQFGNAGGMPDTVYPENGGNELDQVFATVEGDRLHVFVAGNLNADFTKLNVFFDAEPGVGVNQLDGMALPTGVDSFCCGGLDQDGALQRMNGLKFDEGFDADHLVLITQGTESGKLNPPIDFWAVSAHYADLRNGAGGEASGLGMQLAPQGLPNVLRADMSVGGNGLELADDPWVVIPAIDGPTTDYLSMDQLPQLERGDLIDRDYVLGPGGATDDSGAGAIAPELPFALDVDPANSDNSYEHRRFNNVVDLEMAFDNSNVEGVDGFTTAPGMTSGNPQDVMTGVEFSIPLDEIGATAGTDIKMLVFINGTVHDFASNQFSGVGILQGNLGGFSDNDLSMIDGDQFVTISYTPSTGGDFDGNGLYECNDVDSLVAEIVAGTNNPSFDLTNDTLVNNDDLDAWRAEAGSVGGLTASGNPVLEGDANLDGTVDGGDFLIWNGNKFTSVAAWCAGDFNADGTVDGGDFLIWNTNKFQTADGVAAVPEPGSGLLLLLAMSLVGFVRNRR